jgi:uncharacterized protein YcaQ
MVTTKARSMATVRTVGSLTARQARRLALVAQGLGAPPPARVTTRAMRTLLQRLGAIQIDSINVVARSHELVLAARTGSPEAAEVFARAIYHHRVGFEYWGHAASFLPVETYRLFLPRMARVAADERGWSSRHREEHADVYRAVVDRIRAEGPLPASAFRDPAGPKRGSWWDWTPAKHALEDLYGQGVLLVHDRVRFERRYDLAERVLPAGLDVSEPTPEEAAAELILLAARALGVGTVADLEDYFRLPARFARPAVQELTAAGLLERVTVQGWPEPAYVVAGIAVPRKAAFPPVLLSPFDSIIWASFTGRERTLRLFDGFDYKLEIYIPAAKREHGYYTMPLLTGGELVGRVDPKLDRKAGRLLLRAVHLEPGVGVDDGVAAVASAAWRLAVAIGAAEVALDGPAVDGVVRSGALLPGTARACEAAIDAHAPGAPVLAVPDGAAPVVDVSAATVAGGTTTAAR